MDEQDVRDKILEKINMAIDAIQMTHDVDFNEKVSCVVCNLASAYESLNNQ